jgi:hypothetical protein
MARETSYGKCEHCLAAIPYYIIHNGFNDSAYAYCDSCSMVCILSGYFAKIPKNAHLKIHRNITPDIESYLQPCPCGGHFKSGVSPRCPTCKGLLSAELAATYIEANAPGTVKGWRWQRSWTELYSLTIANQVVYDNWKLEF